MGARTPNTAAIQQRNQPVAERLIALSTEILKRYRDQMQRALLLTVKWNQPIFARRILLDLPSMHDHSSHTYDVAARPRVSACGHCAHLAGAARYRGGCYQFVPALPPGGPVQLLPLRGGPTSSTLIPRCCCPLCALVCSHPLIPSLTSCVSALLAFAFTSSTAGVAFTQGPSFAKPVRDRFATAPPMCLRRLLQVVQAASRADSQACLAASRRCDRRAICHELRRPLLLGGLHG